MLDREGGHALHERAEALLGEIGEMAPVAHALEVAVLERRVDDAAGLERNGQLGQHVGELALGKVEDRRARPYAVVGADVGEVLEKLAAHGKPRELARDAAELGRAVERSDVVSRVEEAPGVAPRSAPEIEHLGAGGKERCETPLHGRELDVDRRACELACVCVVVGEGLRGGGGLGVCGCA